MELTPQQQEELDKRRLHMQIADRLRLIFLFLALFAVLFLYFGMKLWSGQAWFDATQTKLYHFLFWDIIFMFLAILCKFFLTFRYNHYVKSL